MKNQKVFFSYSHRDKQIAQKIYWDLIRSGISVWRDQINGEPCANFKEEFLKKVEECEIFFVLHIVPVSMEIMTAALMQVVPGLAIVNAIRDLISGDLMSGTARLVEAFMIAAGLSIGSIFGVLVFSHVII